MLLLHRLPVFILLVTGQVVASSGNAKSANLAEKLFVQSRRILNFSSLLGSATHSKTPYERIAGHPVFQVTTPWGSPYMNMEKLSDLDEQLQSNSGAGSSSSNPQSLSEEQNEYRTVALYFMDPDDALAMHGEMKQMDNMEKADVRITSTSLAKAIRQSSNLGNGLPTGLPPNLLEGTFSSDEGAMLRYKIMPPKRQLYYAARCLGKERVGLFGENAAADAQTAIMGNSALEGMNLIKRREKRERKTPMAKSSMTKMEIENAHMAGYCGIPVFYSPQIRKKLPIHKRLLTGVNHETPLFFNYEDLEDAWETMKGRGKASVTSTMPERPAVEVFNLWDVLTSMEREQWKKSQESKKQPLKSIIGNYKTFSKQKDEEIKSPTELSSITFVPSSRGIEYKEKISARGNGKARLRPMR